MDGKKIDNFLKNEIFRRKKRRNSNRKYPTIQQMVLLAEFVMDYKICGPEKNRIVNKSGETMMKLICGKLGNNQIFNLITY